MFKLHIADKDVTTGSIPITWCVDKKTYEDIKDENPVVVLSVTPDNQSHRETRYVVPFSDLMAYVSFRHPGKNTIRGLLVTGRKISEVKRNYLDGTPSYIAPWTTVIFDDNGEYMPFIKPENNIIPTEPLEINVPEESFAPEPNNFEKAWVFWLINDAVRDQCAFRRRRIFAYTLQPIVFAVSMTIRLTIVTLALMLGLRDYKSCLQAILHPLTTPIGELVEQVPLKGSIFIRPEPKPLAPNSPFARFPFMVFFRHLALRLWAFPFMPFVLVVLYLCWKHSMIGLAFQAWGAIMAILACITCIVAITSLVATRLLSQSKLNEFNEQDVICTGEPKPVKHKTIYLRYQGLKAKICRPFAG